jgi:hypothetical protein
MEAELDAEDAVEKARREAAGGEAEEVAAEADDDDVSLSTTKGFREPPFTYVPCLH